MTDVARITKHPTDRECVLLHTPPDANDRLGKFGPARLSPEHHAFVLHHSHIDALYRFARTVDLHVVDERRTGQHVVRTPPAECAACGQPGAAFNPPTRCPTCGAPWRAIPPPVRDDPSNRNPCSACGHKNPGKFPYCSACGEPMTYEEPRNRTRPHIELPTKRVHLDDPLPLGQVLAETAPRPPARPVEDVSLPDEYEDPEYDPTTEPDWPTSQDDEPQVEDPPSPSWGWAGSE